MFQEDTQGLAPANDHRNFVEVQDIDEADDTDSKDSNTVSDRKLILI